MEKGKIVQIMGPVVDVEFPQNALPAIKDALTVENNGKKLVMEVAQHIGNNTVRCIMLASSDGLYKDMEVMSYQELVEKYLKIRRFDRLINKVSSIIKIRKKL